MIERKRVASESPFEDRVGFCRALRIEDRILVAGTAPIWQSGEVNADPALQTKRCFEIISDALEALGASFRDIVRTRMYLVDADDADAVGAVHGELFAGHRPVATMVIVSRLLDPRWRVEIEVEAVVS